MYMQCNVEIYIPTLVTLVHYTQFFTAVPYVNLSVYLSINTDDAHVKIIYFCYFAYYLTV